MPDPKSDHQRLIDTLSKNSIKFYYHWEACIHSGAYIKIQIIEGETVPIGYCNNKHRDVDFEFECADCKKHKTQRVSKKYEKTPLKKLRIASGRQRSLILKKEASNKFVSKAINEYGEEPKGPIANNNRDTDQSKKAKVANKVSK